MSPTPTVNLAPTGLPMPLLGLGLWKVPNEVCAEAVYNAIKLGYRLLDGASDYGNEVEAGRGVKRAIDEGIVKREELFIISKLWNTFHRQDQVEIQCRRQLKDWGLEYFDLYLIHFPIALKYVDPEVRYPPGWSFDGTGAIEIENSPMHLTWAAMARLPALFLARDIGISNFSGSLIMDLMTYAKIKPAVLQVEMHPFHVQQDLIKLCQAFKIHMMAFCSFGPQSWIELNDPRVDLLPSLFTYTPIVDIAKAHSVSPAQVLLRWGTQRGITVIPKSSNEGRLKENLESTSFDLTESELETISGLDRKFRFNQPAGIDPRISIFA